jgi:hypothetical protein
VRTVVTAALVLASSLGLLASPLHARQSSTQLALSFQAGSAFSGAGVGLAHTTVDGFWSGSGYGFDTGYGFYDHARWSYFPRVSVGFGHRFGCYDGFFYDPFDSFYGCPFSYQRYWPVYPYYQPYHYPYRHAYRPFFSFWPGIHISISIGYPFFAPFYAYDPWGYHWTNWVVYGGGFPRGRAIYVTPGPVYRRPSPIYVAGTTFKEDPRGGGGAAGPERRTAQPRGGVASIPSSSAPRSADAGIQAPPRRTAGATGGTGVTTLGGTSERGSSRGAQPRPSANGDSRRSPTVAPGPQGGTGSADETTGRREIASPPPVGRGEAGTRPRGTLPTVITPDTQRRSTPSSGTGSATGRSIPDVQSLPNQRPTDALRGTVTEVREPDPRRGTERSSSTSEQTRPATTLPTVVVPNAEPRSDRPAQETPQVIGRPSASVPTVRSTPGDAANTRTQPTPARRAQPTTRQSPTSEAAPERPSTQPQRQASPERPSAQPQRQAPPERPSAQPQRQAPPERPSAQPQRQAAPERSSPPPSRQAAPSRPSSPPPAQAAPSSGPRTQAAPPASSGGPTPRRPGGGS